jgi:hypothetical protein
MPNYLSNLLTNEFSSAVKNDEKQKIGIGGFTMLAIGRQGYMDTATAPWVVLEDGSNASDHVFQNPLFVQIEGVLSDVYLEPSALAEAYLKSIRAVGAVDRYLPNRTRQQINAINAILLDITNVVQAIDDVINTGEQIYNMFGDKSDSKSLSQKFIDFIGAVKGQSIEIEFPYKVYKNMIIIDFSPNFTEKHENGYTFRLSAIQVNYAKTIVTDLSGLYKNPSNAVKDQVSPPDEKGINKTKDVDIKSLASELAPNAGTGFANFLKGFIPK